VSTDNAILRAALNALATRIVEIVREGITRDELIPDELPHFRWKLTTDLKYGERGIESKTAAGDTFSKKTWLRAPIQVAGDAGRTSEYKEAVEAVSRSAGATEAQHYIFQFVVVLAKQCLETESTVDTTLLVDRSLRDLSGEAFRCGAEVWLQGLALESDEFRPAPGIVIRRPTRHDLEQEIPYYGPPIGSTYDLPDPTAVAGVELFGRAPQEVQINIEKLITLLRLFKVASVQYSSYKFFSDSVMTTFMGGAMISPRVNVVRETGYLRAHEEKRLTKFFQSMGPILPVSLYHFAGGGSDNVSIAYGRYTAALVRPAIEEELIATRLWAWKRS
jgi:hypothetical protein